MSVRFKSTIRKGNSSGTCFARLISKKPWIKLGERVRISFFVNGSAQSFFAKVVKMDDALGIYIPSVLATKYRLLGRAIHLEAERIDGFGTKAGKDGRVYIPLDYGKKFSLKTGDVVLSEVVCGGESQPHFLKITKRKRGDKVELMATLGRPYSSKLLQIRLKKKLAKNIKSKAGSIDLKKTFGESLFQANGGEMAIFDGKKKSVIIQANIPRGKIALYMGAYFADGTKKGNSWGICASTPAQAKFYLKMHNWLIHDASPVFELSFTALHGKANPAKLIKEWQTEAEIDPNRIKFRIRKSLSGRALKHNDFGTLVIKEHRLAVLKFYTKILSALISEIIHTENKGLAMDFICGVLEGDGTVNAKKRAHVQIATNKHDCPILEKVLAASGLQFKAVKEKGNKFYIRIGALEIIRNLPVLKDKIFIFYPKRRKNLFSRLAAVGGVRFLIGKQPYAASWVKSSLREMGLVDKNYKLTPLGKKVKSSLIAGMKTQNP